MEAIRILWEDDDLLVCVKPAGVLSSQALFPDRRVYPVHRLDRETCGVMVFAKTSSCAARLSAALGTEVRKEYLALCEGCPPAEGRWIDLLYHDSTKNKTYVVQRKRRGVREARLSYRRLSSGETSLVHVTLETGRTHQIRVQFASRGYPLVGDRKYGAASKGALRLYAWKLTFPHPKGQVMTFTLPEEFFPESMILSCNYFSQGV